MSQKLFQICNIIATGEDDYKTLLGYLGNYPLSISKDFPEEHYFDVPTLIIGWNNVKDKFPKQNNTSSCICSSIHFFLYKIMFTNKLWSRKQPKFYLFIISLFYSSVH